jgi:hypothetical protein
LQSYACHQKLLLRHQKLLLLQVLQSYACLLQVLQSYVCSRRRSPGVEAGSWRRQ